MSDTKLARLTDRERADAVDYPHRARVFLKAGCACDTCEARATVNVHDGLTLTMLCADGYLAHLAQIRAARKEC